MLFLNVDTGEEISWELDPDATSFTVPAGTLAPDTSYEVEILFGNMMSREGPVATLYLDWTEIAFDTLAHDRSPAGGATLEERRPAFTWSAVAGATWYRIWINRNGSTYHTQWIQPTDSSPFWRPGTNGLPGGAYQWWVQPWGPGLGYGAWSPAASFTVPARSPGVITLIRPSGSAPGQHDFAWQGDADATWYRLWIQRDGGAAVHDQWYAATGDGEIVVSAQLAPGAYAWWLQPWGPDGSGPWSGPMSFSR